MSSPAYGGIMRQPATPPGSGPQAKVLDMSVPSHADVIVLHRRPGPALLRGDLALEGRPLPPLGAGDPAAGADLRDAVFKRITLRGSSSATSIRSGCCRSARSSRRCCA